MTAQNIFYIIGSITLTVFLLFLIFAVAVLYGIGRRIRRAERGFRLLRYELRGMFQSGKSYSRYMGASIGSSILGKLLKILRG